MPGFPLPPRALPVRLRAAAAMAAMLVPAAVAPASAQQIELLWKPQAGTAYVYRQIDSARVATPMGDMLQVQDARVRQTVRSVAADGAAEIEVLQESLRLEQSGPMGDAVYDSELGVAPESPEMRAAALSVGSVFTMVVGPDGAIRSVSGTETLIDRIAAELGTEGPEVAAAVREMLERTLGEEAMIGRLQQGAPPRPTTPIAAGAEWSQQLAIPIPFGTTRHELAYTLRDVVTEGGRRLARVDVRGTVSGLDVDPGSPLAGMLTLSGGSTEGELHLEVDTGTMVRYHVRNTVSMSVMGQEMTTQATQLIELVERVAADSR